MSAAQSASLRPEIQFMYPPKKEPEEWRAAYERSDRPDQFMYGLQHLVSDERFDLALAAQEPLLTHVLQSVLLNAIRPRPRGSFVTWEEQCAVREFLRRGPRSPFASGVIWATDPAGSNPWRRALTASVLKRARLLWCLSMPQVQASADWLDRDDIKFLRFGVDEKFYHPSGCERNEPIVFSAGDDRHRDGRTLLAVLERVRAAAPRARFVVQSKTIDRIPNWVQLHRWIPHRELADMYRRAAVVIVPTMPNDHVSGMTVALEAMASGCPVGMCDTAGVEDYIVPGETGFVFRPGDVSTAAANVVRLLEDRTLQKRVGQNARRYVEQNHTSAATMRQLGDLLARAGWR